MNPAASPAAVPSGVSPRPLMCEWLAMREECIDDDEVGGGGRPSRAIVVDPDPPLDVDAFIFARYTEFRAWSPRA